jgi:hypothetical protein
MTEIIVTKRCNLCVEMKPVAEFGINRASRDGLNNRCKSCVNARLREIRKTPKEKARMKAFARQHYSSPKGSEWWRNYRARIRGTPKRKARDAVRTAIKSGRLLAACKLACRNCGQPAAEYHHHQGYEREHWLHVIPLCSSCHKKADRSQVFEKGVIKEPVPAASPTTSH